MRKRTRRRLCWVFFGTMVASIVAVIVFQPPVSKEVGHVIGTVQGCLTYASAMLAVHAQWDL